MTTRLDAGVSRRCFLASASAATAVALVAPRKLFAQDDGLVQTELSPQAVRTRRTQSGATALGAPKTSSETLSIDVIARCTS